MCYGYFTHSWEGEEQKSSSFPSLPPECTQGLPTTDLPLHRHTFVIHLTHDGKENLPSCWAGWDSPSLWTRYGGWQGLQHSCRPPVEQCRRIKQSFLRMNGIKNTSEPKFMQPKLNPNLPKVQGCSGLRFSFSHVSGDLRNPFTLQREKQEAETVSPPGPFLQLSWLVWDRLFWLQAQTGGTLLCSVGTAFSAEH